MSFKNLLTFELVVHAVKSAIAGAGALYIAEIVQLPQGYWAAISALVVMGADVGETFKASRDRLIGTAVGAVTGGFSPSSEHVICYGSLWRCAEPPWYVKRCT
jgi:uncharacterized membrane protein YccC